MSKRTPRTRPSPPNAAHSRARRQRSQPTVPEVVPGEPRDEEQRPNPTAVVATNSNKKKYRHRVRLRDRVHMAESRLTLDVNALNQQITDLELHRSLMNSKAQLRFTARVEGAIKQVVEYFGAFHRGWIHSANGISMARLLMAEGQPSSFAVQLEQQLLRRQRRFVGTVLAPDMQFIGRDDGLELFLEQWRLYSEYHHIPRLNLIGVTHAGTVDDPIVIADGFFSGYITEFLLEEVFPHILSHARIRVRLVGAFIEYPCRVVYYFDDNGRITRYEAELNYASALLGVLGNLHDVGYVLSRALLRSNVIIGHDHRR